MQLTFLNGGFHFQVFGSKPNGWVRQFNTLAAMKVLDIARYECVRALGDILSQGHEVGMHFVQAGNSVLVTHVVQLYRSRRRGDISSSVPFAAIGSPGDSAGRELPLAPEFARS